MSLKCLQLPREICDFLGRNLCLNNIECACSFAVGAYLPLCIVLFAPAQHLIPIVASGALVLLAFLGGLAAKAGGAKIFPAVVRVTFWSTLALGVTFGVGALFGAKSG